MGESASVLSVLVAPSRDRSVCGSGSRSRARRRSAVTGISGRFCHAVADSATDFDVSLGGAPRYRAGGSGRRQAHRTTGWDGRSRGTPRVDRF